MTQKTATIFVDVRRLHLSSSRRTSSSALRAERRNIPNSCGQTHQVNGKVTTTAHLQGNHLHNHTNHAHKSWRSGSSIILPGWRCHTGGPGRYPQYTRADFGPEAVGSSYTKHHKSPINTLHGKEMSRMVAELEFQTHGTAHAVA